MKQERAPSTNRTSAIMRHICASPGSPGWLELWVQDMPKDASAKTINAAERR